MPFRVSGFPTLKFKQAGSRDFLDYDGDRALDSLIAFVEQTAKNSLEPKIQVTPEGQVPLSQPTTEIPKPHQSPEREEHDEL